MSNMEFSEPPDYILLNSMDNWDLYYLGNLFSGDVEEGSNLELLNSSDAELLSSVEKLERDPYQPIVEDITMDDEDLVRAVDQIESE